MQDRQQQGSVQIVLCMQEQYIGEIYQRLLDSQSVIPSFQGPPQNTATVQSLELPKQITNTKPREKSAFSGVKGWFWKHFLLADCPLAHIWTVDNGRGTTGYLKTSSSEP